MGCTRSKTLDRVIFVAEDLPSKEIIAAMYLDRGELGKDIILEVINDTKRRAGCLAQDFYSRVFYSRGTNPRNNYNTTSSRAKPTNPSTYPYRYYPTSKSEANCSSKHTAIIMLIMPAKCKK